MLDQNTDRMWYVIGAIVIGAAILAMGLNIYTDSFGSVSDSFEQGIGITDATVSVFDEESIEHAVKVKDYIPIASADELSAIRNSDSQIFGEGTRWRSEFIGGLDKKYIQVSDIDLSDYDDWTPIDNFTGIYEGSGFIIRRAQVNSESRTSNGLFGSVQGATIENVVMEDVSINGSDHVGGLVGQASDGSILDSIIITGSIRNSGAYNGPDISLGGIVGKLDGYSKLTNSHANVKLNGRANVGGLVGHLRSSEIKQSYVHGSSFGLSSLGGLAGLAESNAKVKDSYASIKLDGSDISKGGLIGSTGFGNVVVDSSYWDVNTAGTTKTADDKGSGQSSFEMKIARTYKDWDFEDLWRVEEGKTYPSFDGENSRLDEVTITFIDNKDKEHKVTGLVGSSLNDYYDGTIPSPVKSGHTFIGWETASGKAFDMDTKLKDEDLTIVPKWKLNEIVTKTFYLDEELGADQIKDIEIENMHEMISYDVDKGKIDLLDQKDNNLQFELSDRPYDRRVQTGGVEIQADSKQVEAQDSSRYNKDGYTGSLSEYLYSGRYTPEDTKYVSGETSSSYNSGGYKGSLSQYLAGGSYTSADSKTVSGQTSSYYNSGGYSGSLSRYQAGGSYTPADSKSIREETHLGYEPFSENPSSLSHRNHTNYGSASAAAVAFGRGYLGNTKSYNSNGYTGTLRVTSNRSASRSESVGVDYKGYEFGDVTIYITYTGTVTRPASDTRYYRYSGTVTRPASDTRYYRYRGNVTRPASDTRVYKYKGTVKRPYSDTRTWDHYYKYAVTVSYREK